MSPESDRAAAALSEAEPQPTARYERRGWDEQPTGRRERFRARTLAVSVEGPLLRAVAFSGRRIVAWATLDLDDPDGAALPPELAEFTRGGSRQLIDLPFYASLVRYLDKPTAGRRYLDQVVAMEVGNTIPFAEDEVDLRWKMIQDGRGPEVMAWAVPRWEVDAYVQLVGVTGVRPSAAYAKPLALAAAVGRSNVAIAHLTRTEAELVLVRDQVPRRVHRVELPRAPEDAIAYAGALAQAVDELCAASDASQGPSGHATMPVVLTGDVPPGDTHAEALAEAFGDRLDGPSLSFDHPSGFPPMEYAANVGLALADWDRPVVPWRRSPTQQLVIDLLPERHRRRRVPWRALALAALYGALAAGAVAATALVNDIERSVEAMELGLAGVHRQVRIDNVAAARESSLRLKLDAIGGQVDALEAQARANRDEMAQLLERLRLLTTGAAGPAVTVSDVTLAGGEVRLSGTAPTYEAVVAFADAVRARGLFTGLRTTDASGTSAGAAGGSVGFNMIGAYPEADDERTGPEPGEDPTP